MHANEKKASMTVSQKQSQVRLGNMDTYDLPVDQQKHFFELLEKYNQNLAKLHDENMQNVQVSLKYFIELYNFHQRVDKLQNVDLFSKLQALFIETTDINILHDILQVLYHFTSIFKLDIAEEFLQSIIIRLGDSSVQKTNQVIEMDIIMLELLIRYFNFVPELDPKFIELLASNINFAPNLDILVNRFMVKYQKYHFNPNNNEIIAHFINFALNSSYANAAAFYIIKLMLKTLTQNHNREVTQNFDELIRRLCVFWQLEDSNVNSMLFLLLSFDLPQETLILFLQNGGSDAITKSIANDDIISENCAFILLSELLDNWHFSFTIDDTLAIAVNRIYNGTMKVRNMAGCFMAKVATKFPQHFVESFNEYNTEDDDENPDPKNYARAYAFLLKHDRGINKDELYDSLCSIGSLFNRNDKMHEFRNTCAGYDIDTYAESDACDDEYSNSATIFYETYITGRFEE